MLGDLNALHFEKISRFDRLEPTSFGVPFAKGELAVAEDFRLLDGENVIPSQVRVTSCWPDGSVRWLFVRALVSLPGNASKTISFSTEPGKAQPMSSGSVDIQENGDGGLDVNTGRLSFSVPTEGFLPLRNMRFDGQSICDSELFRGISLKWGDNHISTSNISVKLTVEESGPVCAVILLEAEPPDDTELPVFRARLFCWAGLPWLVFQPSVINRSDAPCSVTPVRDWAFELALTGDKPTLRVGHGCYRDTIVRQKQDGAGVGVFFDANYILGCAVEHEPDSFAVNSWADWESTNGGVQVSLRHAAQNFPTAYNVEFDTMRVELYSSAEQEPLEWFAGTAKTHEILLHFHGPNTSDEALSVRALQFHIPDVPSLQAGRYAAANVWHQPIFGSRLPSKVINHYARVADSRPLGWGVFNFGDEHDAAYTMQGRGADGKDEGDRLIWANNEYDFTHHIFLFHALTGQRRFRDYALTSARHWMDVDIVHSQGDPLLRDGHRAHVRRHAGKTHVGPSHQWVQGLFDLYHATGDPDAYAAAVGVADNILRLIEGRQMLVPGKYSTREMGWALRSMLNAWRETGDSRYHDMGVRIVALFNEWDKGGGALLSPYTSHADVRVPFMNALTAASLAMWAVETDDDTGKRIAIAVADDLLEHAVQPWGMMYYKELPSVQRPMSSPHMLELLAYVYSFTGERRYLEAGLIPLQTLLETGPYRTARRKVPMTNGIYMSTLFEAKGGISFASSLDGVLHFISVAKSEELNRGLDYNLRLE